jgi:hypothetical protein
MLTQWKIKSNLEHLLKNYKHVRDSDLLLWIYYANKFLWASINEAQISKLKQTPSFQNIARIRREFQKKWMYEWDPKVKEEREKKYMNYKNHFGWNWKDNDVL